MTQAVDPLPPPQSGLPLEVSFRRILKCCEDIATGDNKGRSDLDDWARSPVFHATVEALQEQAADLESFSSNRIDPEVLRAYRMRVDALSARILPVALPEYCMKRSSASDSKPPGAFASMPAVGHARLETAKTPASTAAATEVRQRKGLSGPLHKTTQERLDRHKNLQDSLTDEMVALAAGLKRNAQAMQQAVNQRGGLLEATEDAVEESLAHAQRSSKESRALKVRGSITFCMILMAVFFVAAVFLGTYIFIKTTSFVGYKARPR